MSIQRLYAPLLAVALMAAGGLIQGCSSGGGGTASAPTLAAKADVTVAATFPASAAATKSLIPTATKAIYVYFGQDSTYLPYTNPGAYALKLTAASPSGTLKMAPGTYYVYAAAFDADTEDPTTKAPMGKRLAKTSTAGVINLGSNIVNLTFLDGVWTSVDGSGNASPIVLSDGTQLLDLVVGGSQGMYPAKAAFDFSKPVLGGSGLLKYRFNNNTSARGYGSFLSQFIGADNSIAVFADQYNLTQKCSRDFSYASTSSCDPAVGDRLVMMQGNPGGTGTPPESYSSDSSGILTGNAYALLPNKGQTSFTQNGVAVDLKSKVPAATVSGGNTMTGNLMEVVIASGTRTLATAAAKPVTAKVVQAQSTNTPYTGITATDYDIYVCSPTGGTNTGTWQFYSPAKTVGSATCYKNASLLNFNPATGQPVTPNAGDYSYGLVPTDTTKLGEYCHQFDYQNKTCLKQQPGPGEIYYPGNFYDLNGDKVIDYGSFKLNFWVQETMSGTIYVYPFTAKGKAP